MRSIVPLMVLLLAVSAVACSTGARSQEPTPHELSTWAVGLCSALTEFSTSASALQSKTPLMSLEETRRYAIDAASMLYKSSGQAVQTLADVMPPAGTTSLHASVRAQMASIQQLSQEALKELPGANEDTEIRGLVLAILVAAEQSEEDIAEDLNALSPDARAAIDALSCPLPQ